MFVVLGKCDFPLALSSLCWFLQMKRLKVLRWNKAQWLGTSLLVQWLSSCSQCRGPAFTGPEQSVSSCPVTRFSQACPSRPADAVTVARGGLFAGTAPSSPGLHSPSGSFSASSWLLPPPDSHQGSPQSTGGAWLRFHTQAPGPTRPCRPARQVPQRPWAADQPSHQQSCY